MGQNFDLERLRTFTPSVPKVSLQDFLPISSAPRPKIGNIWKLDTFGRPFVKKTLPRFWSHAGQKPGRKTVHILCDFPALETVRTEVLGKAQMYLSK